MASCKGRGAFWERVVSEQDQSGLSGQAWCEANGVGVAAFYRWRKRLSSRALSVVGEPGRAGIEWLPVERGPATSATASASVSSPSSGVSLRVGAVCVEIATGFDRSALSDVLSVLETRSRVLVESRC